MRKFLLLILTVLILVLGFFFIRDGIELGNIRVLGIYEIQELNKELDTKLLKATELAEVQLPKENDELNDVLTEAVKLRGSYEKALEQNKSEDISEILKTEKYEIEKLWISIGNYADEHNVKVNLQVTNSSSGVLEVKDLNFIVNGSYVGITDFIYDLEDDPELEFKIEKFTLVPDGGATDLKATFTVRDVNVNISTVNQDTEDESDMNDIDELSEASEQDLDETHDEA